MYQNKDNTLPVLKIGSFFNTLECDAESIALQQELNMMHSVPMLKRHFVNSLTLNNTKLEYLLKLHDITRYLEPQAILRVAAAKESCCQQLIKAEIYKEHTATWEKLNRIAASYELMRYKEKPNTRQY